MTEFATCWGLVGGSLLIASPIVFFKIKEHSSVEADLQFSDETAGEVIGVQMQDQRDLDAKHNEEHDSGSQGKDETNGEGIIESVGQGEKNTTAEHEKGSTG